MPTISNLVAPIEYEAPPHVSDAIAAMGRTEDLAFSPSGRRIVITEFLRHRLFILDIDAGERDGSGRFVLTDCVELVSRSFLFPHGVCFLDEDTVAVANRESTTQIYRLPASGTGVPIVEGTPLQIIRGPWFRRNATPGSVAVRPHGNVIELLICNNYQDTVTRHVVDPRRNFRVTSNHLRMKAGLSVPDGVAVSSDGRWTAISNHGTHAVLVLDNAVRDNSKRAPSAVLREIDCPHGLAFADDGRKLIVASAAAPVVHVFGADDSGVWSGERNAVAVLPVMDEETFLKGRTNAEEGGPKGLDISVKLNVVATTSEHQPLAFFDRETLLSAR